MGMQIPSTNKDVFQRLFELGATATLIVQRPPYPAVACLLSYRKLFIYKPDLQSPLRGVRFR